MLVVLAPNVLIISFYLPVEGKLMFSVSMPGVIGVWTNNPGLSSSENPESSPDSDFEEGVYMHF